MTMTSPRKKSMDGILLLVGFTLERLGRMNVYSYLSPGNDKVQSWAILLPSDLKAAGS